MSDGNITLNTNGTFTVKSGGIFSINDNTITGSGDGTQIVTVENGGIFKCGTNKGFNGVYHHASSNKKLRNQFKH